MANKYDRPGQPTLYKPEYCQQLIDFMSVDHYSEVVDVVRQKDYEKESTRLVANPLPFISAFARSIKVSTVTLYEWASVHPEFSNAMTCARELQTEHIATNGMLGLFNPQFTKFAAVNMTDWRDKQEVEHSGNVSLSSRMQSLLSDDDKK